MFEVIRHKGKFAVSWDNVYFEDANLAFAFAEEMDKAQLKAIGKYGEPRSEREAAKEEPKPPKAKTPRLTKEQKENIEIHRKAGATAEEIAGYEKISTEQVEAYLKKRGKV